MFMIYYLDTNIFIYVANPDDPRHSACLKILKLSAKDKIFTGTSVETIQEIIFYSQRRKRLKDGLKLAKNVLKVVSGLLPVEQEVIEKYLSLVKKYPKVESRDLIHAATCLVYGFDRIVSVDTHFDRIKEVKRLDPAKFPKI